MALFSLEVRSPREELIAPSSILSGTTRKPERDFVRNCSERTRYDGYKLKEGKL